jgi:predicted DCC family thiol-disulfide oxidoreductase YuxK
MSTTTANRSPSSPVEYEQSRDEDETARWDVEVFFDGDCPLCVHEIGMLRWMDRRERIRFTDISDGTFDPQLIDKTMSELMAEIHGRLPNGEMIVGVEVFRRLYAAVGLGPLVALTRLPLISHGLDLGYRIFARNRLRFTGRCQDAGCSV